MRKNRAMPKCCRFCVKGNDCPILDQVMTEDFPLEKHGFLISAKEWDLMGTKLNYRFLCYEPVYTGVKQ